MQSPNRFQSRCIPSLLVATAVSGVTACTARPPDMSVGLDRPVAPAALATHEVQVNSFTSSTQEHAALAVHATGESVVVWDSRRQQRGTYGIYLQRFDAVGAPLGGETQVNIETASMQMRPAVAVDGLGGTWVAWQSFGQDGSMAGIVARRFDRAFVGSDEILVNQEREGLQGDVVVAADSKGNATFFWTTPDRSGAGERIVAGRQFDRNGNARTDEFAIVETHAHWENLPAVTIDGRDRIVVAWAEAGRDGVPTGVRARVFDEQARPIAPAFPVSDAGLHIEPAVAAGVDGSFLVAWMSAIGEDYSVSRRRFSASAEPLEPAQVIAAPGTHKYFSGVAAAMDADGTSTLAWNARAVDGYHDDVHIQRFDADGQATGAAERVNRHTDGSQRLGIASGTQRLAAVAGRSTLAWAGETAQGDKSAVGLTVVVPSTVAYDLTAPSSGAAASNGSEAAQPYEPPVFDPKMVSDDPFGGDPHPFAADGGDFGFIGVVNTGWNPPDPHLACGPNHVVVMTNGEIAFFSKDGTNTFRDEIENSFGFWGTLGADNFVFDPEVIFDPHSNRFMAMACERSDDSRSKFLLAVSDDDDPNGNWFKYRFDVTALAGNDIDSPNIAVDDQAVYLTSDHFGPSDYLVFIVRKSDVLVGNPNPLTRNMVISEHSYGIPVTYDAGAPAQYMIQAFEFGTFNEVRLHAITDPLGTPQRVTTLFPVPTYSHPEDPPQMGTTSRPELFEARFWNCMYRNGSLWAVHHEGGARVRARWYEIAMNGWPNVDGGMPTLVQTGHIDAGAGIRTFFPSIWVDAAGNAAITTSRSSSQEFISMSRAVRLASDPPGEFQPIEFVRESDGPKTGRWGDYSNTVSDPAQPGVFWGHNEYTPGGNSWNTWIAKYELGIACTGDANGDGVVNFTDILAVLAAWGPCGGCPEDFDSSGAVDIADLIAVLTNWGACP